MKKLASLGAGLVAAALLCVASASPSRAATTAYVSGGGNDANSCTTAQPCRSIFHALNSVAGNGGTVSCLDPGPYTEAFTSYDSFTLDCPGVVYAAADNFAISLLPVTGLALTFRHVIFDGGAGGTGAVAITGGGRLVFEDCTFQNFTASPGEAIQFAPTAAGAQLTISDSVFTNNGTASGGGGIVIQPTGAGAAGAVIERTQVTGNTNGIVANGPALVEVTFSTISNNAMNGIMADATNSVASIVVAHSASVRNSGGGINATGAGAYVSLNDSTVTWNATGLSATSGGTILSYRNNVIAGNPNPGVTPVSVGQQ